MWLNIKDVQKTESVKWRGRCGLILNIFRQQKAVEGGLDVVKFQIYLDNRKLWKEGWMWLNIKYVQKTESFGWGGWMWLNIRYVQETESFGWRVGGD